MNTWTPKPDQKCKTCDQPLYAVDHDGGCPIRLGDGQKEDDGYILGEVWWWGAKPDQYGGHTIGELMPPFDTPKRF